MADTFFDLIPLQSDITADDFFIGTRIVLGTPTDSRYTPSQLIALLRKVITVSTGGSTLTDTFFSNDITEIVANNQCYIVDVDFTQSGTTITATSFSFYAGQTIIAKL